MCVYMCVCGGVDMLRACVPECVRACVCVWGGGGVCVRACFLFTVTF